MENFFRELHYKISSRILIIVFLFSKEMTTCVYVENTIYLWLPPELCQFNKENHEKLLNKYWLILFS